MKKPQVELLSPAGSMETLKAVTAAGADAVYAAGTKFGARAYANNFTEEELLYAIDYLHLHDKRLYLTVNTLLKEEELNQELYDYMKPLYLQGLDGVIIQDLGVLAFLREHFPGMELHASTQMTITGPYGARLMKELGCSRIVTARELSLVEIREIHEQTDIEIESFIHGALCYCYSGQCLLSSMLGGRSGNRGRCAQPCRLPYQTKSARESYLLSPKDLCTIELLPQIIESGVYSLKIEGRMKQAEYASGVTSIYREYLDRCLKHPGEEYKVSPKDWKRLEELGSRSGFTSGYYLQQNGPEMITMKKPAHTKSNEALQEEMRQRFVNQKIQEKMKGILNLSKDNPEELVLKCKNKEVAVRGELVQKAKSRPMEQSVVEEKLRKTGESDFCFDSLEIHMEDDIFIPIGALNQLRRDGIAALKQELLKEYAREMPGIQADIQAVTAQDGQSSPYLAVSVQTVEQCIQILAYPYVERIYIDSGAFDRAEGGRRLSQLVRQVHEAGKKLFYVMPPVMRGSTICWYQKHLPELMDTGIEGFVAGGFEALQLLREADCRSQIITDSSLYAWSGWSAAVLKQLGVHEITLPLEANERELRNRRISGGELIIYGYLPLMVSAQCVVKNTEGCRKKTGFTMMKDRYGKNFTVKNQCQDCVNILYNTSPLSLLHQAKAVMGLKTNGLRISFTKEDKEQVAEIMSWYQQGFLRKEAIDMERYLKDFTNGHFKRGVE